MSKMLKSDKYRKSRGGYSRLLGISCEKCSKHVCFYQKDGPGGLRRMYIDRIIESNVSTGRKDLSCPNGHLLGVKFVYEKEKRPAYRLFVDAVVKKLQRVG
jgi:hypothetical protein